MSEMNSPPLQESLRSPRSAAIAGILYAIMGAASMMLIENIVTVAPAEVNPEWFNSWSSTVSVVLFLVSISGIAFLWFTGVIRELIGDRENRFFATIYFGSAIILVVLLFIWAATLGAMFGAFTMGSDILVGGDIYIFGFAMMNEIVGNFALRVAGVYMISIGTVWTRAAVTPRWLTLLTFLVAIGFLFFAGAFREARFIFPAWVFLVSVYILVRNYRRPDQLRA